MSVDIDRLCADCEALIGKARYPQKGSGSTNYNSIMNGAQVDCSGLFVAVFARQGASIYHGSNTIWRKYLSDKGSISDHKSSNGYPKNTNPLKSSQLEKGMALFKWNNNTPSKFNDGLGDYQHIGIVTSVKPLRIVHSTSENHKGVTVDTSIGKWCAWGKFKAAKYDEDNTPAQDVDDHKDIGGIAMSGIAKTTVDLNMRKGPGTDYDKILTASAGSKVTLLAKENDWYKVEYKGKTGYMIAKYLKITTPIKEQPEEDYDEIPDDFEDATFDEDYEEDDDDDPDPPADEYNLEMFKAILMRLDDIERRLAKKGI